MRQRQRRQYGWVAALMAGVMLGFPQSGAARGEPVLHERYESSATEDALLQATTLDGTLPAALATQSGAVSLNDLRANDATAAPLQTESSDYSQDYRADSDTRRPELVGYSDPFSPTIPPYKRAYAYDTVGPQFELQVAAPALRSLAVGGAPRLDDDQFYADLQIDLPRNVAVRIPSVGPATRVIVAQVKPQQDFGLFKDGADNWFLQSSVEGVVQLTLHLAIDRRSFGTPYPRVSWGTLRSHLPPLPEEVRDAAHTVAQEIGVTEQQAPAVALERLVEHFRSFLPSEVPLGGDVTGEPLYRALSLNKQGVCRHRAYAFTVTALGIGIPTRFVRNEAHAWVEVFDGELWHRVDLGGAAARAVFDLGDRPVHVEPRDPYPWPERSTSAHEMTERALRDRASTAGATPSSSAAQSVTESRTPAASPSSTQSDLAPPATLTINTPHARVTRGERLDVSGRVSAAAALCGRVRVDLWLLRGSHERHPLGTLMTDDLGTFSGGVLVPFSVPVGNYDVEATTPGRSPVCGPGRSQR
jgi:hypothetical protein